MLTIVTLVVAFSAVANAQFDPFVAWTGVQGSFDVGRCKALMPVDANGDGLPDVVCVADFGVPTQTTATFVQINKYHPTAKSEISASLPTPAQTNSTASGRSSGSEESEPNGFGTPPELLQYFWNIGQGGTAVTRGQIVDLNNDGFPDLVHSYAFVAGSSESQNRVYLNNGAGWVLPALWTPPLTPLDKLLLEYDSLLRAGVISQEDHELVHDATVLHPQFQQGALSLHKRLHSCKTANSQKSFVSHLVRLAHKAAKMV